VLESRPRVAWAARRLLAGYHSLAYALRQTIPVAGKTSCPCCGATPTGFRPYLHEAKVECPQCASHERHRLLCYYLFEDRPELLEHATSLLHFAPEPCLEGRFRVIDDLRYVTADLNPRHATVSCDITDLPFEEAAFDVILCSHVLEHVEDDRAALLEIARVLRPGGTALILVPLDESRAQTYEDDAIRSPAARAAAYWEPGHLRLYGLDFARRLEAAGLVVSVDRYVHQLDRSLVAKHNMRSGGVYVCTKPSPP